jgi:peptide/nickel transport system substrate-binding protein
VTINAAKPPMDKLLVRQAVAHGLDRARVSGSFYAGRAVVAHEFMPPSIPGYAKNVKKYAYNPAKAKQLLQQAGLELPVEIEFWYPTDVSRPYMPDPKRNFEAFKASLEKAGFKVTAKSAPWRPDYVSAVNGGSAGHLNLIGWTGDYADADNFAGTFFREARGQWGPVDNRIHKLLQDAVREPNPELRVALYQRANRLIAEQVPGVPYVHTKPALAFRRNVAGYVPSPTTAETFDRVRMTG